MTTKKQIFMPATDLDDTNPGVPDGASMRWGKQGRLLAPAEKAPRGTKKIINLEWPGYRLALGLFERDTEVIEFEMPDAGGKA